MDGHDDAQGYADDDLAHDLCRSAIKALCLKRPDFGVERRSFCVLQHIEDNDIWSAKRTTAPGIGGACTPQRSCMLYSTLCQPVTTQICLSLSVWSQVPQQFSPRIQQCR
jgi:hypothetical protein